MITFIRQRSAIRVYLNYLFRTTRDLGYFNETQAIEVSDNDFFINDKKTNFLWSYQWSKKWKKNKKKSVQMRNIFWSTDKDSDNNFRSAEPLFWHTANWRFEKTHYIPRKHFEIMAWTIRLMPDYDQIFEWNLF